jgi:hypothetical protein
MWKTTGRYFELDYQWPFQISLGESYTLENTYAIAIKAGDPRRMFDVTLHFGFGVSFSPTYPGGGTFFCPGWFPFCVLAMLGLLCARAAATYDHAKRMPPQKLNQITET